jgi:glycolate oxidase iron-sulfur subunit
MPPPRDATLLIFHPNANLYGGSAAQRVAMQSDPRTPFRSGPVGLIIVLNQTMSPQPIPGLNPVYEDYARCVHCGLCLNACPTYRLWNLEADSPRGRIHQMIQVELNQQPITDSFADHIDKCLDCRACETACPSGVEYGKLVEHARARIERDHPRSWLATVTRDFIFRHLLPDPHRIIDFARVLRIYQRSGLQTIARGIGVLKLLGLAERERFLPRIDDSFFYRRHGWTFPAAGPRRARVAFFAGCIANVTFSQLNEATVRVLSANGCEVVVPKKQFCCGALAAHAGVRDAARELARKNFSAFLRNDFDAIITNAAGCGSTLKEYDRLFSLHEEEHSQARAFAAKTRDVTEFLAALGVTAKMKPLPLRVTYQDSCHLLHGQKIREAPRTLLRAIPNLDFVELPYSEICCGSAGVYNVTQTGTSLELLAEKMQYAQSTRAQVIVTANPGCLLQLRAGAAIHRTNQEVLHVVELLDRAMVSA